MQLTKYNKNTGYKILNGCNQGVPFLGLIMLDFDFEKKKN